MISEMNLNFSVRTIGEWRELLQQTTRPTWTHTFQFAQAVAKIEKSSTHFVTIEKRNEIIGIVAIQEMKLGPIHLVTVYRGPLWLKGHECEENIRGFTKVFNRKYPQRLLRRIRWLPEWNLADSESFHFIEDSGFKKTQQTFETLWVDLTQSLESMRAHLQQKWRNGLNKALRSPMTISVDTKGAHLDVFLKEYKKFKAQRKFKGPSAEFFKHEIESALTFKDALILWARREGVPVAGIVIMKHGTTASYRVGWNTTEGRQHNAHYLLLWTAIEVLKRQNIEALDLGGILADENEGLNKFKQGLNGQKFKTEILK